jgi:ABC-type microcin C transport system permease subunit YejB
LTEGVIAAEALPAISSIGLWATFASYAISSPLIAEKDSASRRQALSYRYFGANLDREMSNSQGE